ncbi:unnamed protein product, partial [Prorocentrum cordatum]
NLVKRLMEEKTVLEQHVLGLELQVRRSEDPEVQRRVDAIVPCLEEEVSARRRGDTAVRSQLEAIMRIVAMHVFDVPMAQLLGLNFKQLNWVQRRSRVRARRDKGTEVVSEAEVITAPGAWTPDPTAAPFVPLAQLHEHTMSLGMQGRQRHQPFAKRRRLCDAAAAVDAKTSGAIR